MPPGGRGRGRGMGPGGPGGPPAFGKMSRLVEPALLYLLAKHQRAHGYDLIAQANELPISDTHIDAGAVYRVLRQMEDNGLVASTWDTTGAGPAKREYEITAAGRTHLKAWAEMLRRRGQSMMDFASECERLK